MNYYEILGVSVDSDFAEIKAAYRRLARKYHPDVNSGNAKRFKSISEAYETLSDSEKRKQYDILNKIFKSQKTADNAEKEETKQTFEEKPKTAPKQKPKQKNFKNDMNIFDLFKIKKEFHEQKVPQNGSDVNTDVTITLAEAFQGCEKVVNIVHSELCPRCKGRKFINGSKCDVCNGSGEYSVYKRLNVKIPANIKDGSKLRIKNEGNEGKFGGKSGDLYLFIHIKDNLNVAYDGLNVLYKASVSPFDAVLGCELELPNNVKLKVPAKTSSGQKFRLASQGLKKNGKTGDMIVTVTIDISKDLSDDEIKMYEKLKRMSKY